ncbi:hypothetical protein GF359_09485 [candidate division WOR-3 bacterium]|uniref:Uncharacterized protein n=1 Tax=candidate division WOR-3 bacterium TaxID=2052148 RepID=A0A9D5QEX3_UNCW3|nr:hypothetical protein [candidate division WOR-3 bacterium]MBD3365430.1 hypothetical protein [candidate division WOR-3 bacterium]
MSIPLAGCRQEGKKLNLDSTCFPYGIGYEWTYVRYNTGYTNWGETLEENWDKVDTFTVRVVDSTWFGDTLLFQLRGKGSEGYPGQILDVGNPVKIWGGNVQLHLVGGNPFDTVISLSPASGDTLRITHSDGDTTGFWVDEIEIVRVKGIGTIFQEYRYNEPSAFLHITDSLLTFTTPEGQRYP